MRFQYTGYEQGSNIVSGWLSAHDRDDALTDLKRRNIHPLKLKEVTGDSIRLEVKDEAMLVSFRELAGLLESGMALDNAVKTTMETASGKLQTAWTNVHEMIRSGSSLSVAIDGMPNFFHGSFVPVIRIGEIEGTLVKSLNTLADQLEEEANLRGELTTALTYPFFVVVISVLVVSFLVLFVVPKFGAIFDTTSGEPPVLLQILLSTSGFVRNNILILFFLVSASVTALVYWFRSGSGKRVFMKYLWLMPWIGKNMEFTETVRFCNAMSSLLGSGVSLVEALQLAINTLKNEIWITKLGFAVDKIREGKTFTASVEAAGIFPTLAIQLMDSGEKGAYLAKSMEQVSKIFHRRLQSRVKKGIALLEPAVIVVLGVVVGSIIITLLSAIISVNDVAI